MRITDANRFKVFIRLTPHLCPFESAFSLKKMIWFILLTASIVRIWGINFALPLRCGHTDEAVVIAYTIRFFTGLNPEPFFDYPTLYLYILFILYCAYFILGLTAGKFGTIPEFITSYYSNAAPFILIGRFLTVTFSIATVYLTYIFAKKLFDRKTGLLAALFLSLSWQHVLSSHYATTDIMAAFLTLVTVFFVWEICLTKSLKSYILAGLFCGLSIASKYYGGIIFPLILLFGWKNKKYLGISFLMVIIGFFIGCPYAFIDYSGFLARFYDRFNLIIGWSQSAGAIPGSHNAIPFSALLNYPKIFLEGLGYFLAVSAFAGFIILIINRTKENIFLMTVILILLVFFGSWKSYAGRYTLALYPFFGIISGLAVKKIKNKAAFTAVLLVFAVVTLPKIIKTDILLSEKDTRVIAREWILKNIPGGSKILRGPRCPEFPNDSYLVKIDYDNKIKKGSFKNISKEFDYVITSSLHTDPETFTDSLQKNGKVIYEISKESIGEDQNPAIKIYKLNGPAKDAKSR
ncbi:MAG: glycosyltransferase family 39 protein [Elusimicrobia bacterium]|nr:glycosyltransferase family 39 protein [Elusimicrobiota bacterium]